MGNLSNLYISRSFQSLIHLGTDNVATADLTTLQDGYGNSIGIEVNTGGDLYLSGSLSSTLNKGYIWVGDASNRTSLVATSSLVTNIDTSSLVTNTTFNTYTSSTNIRLNNLENNSASVNVSISNLNSTTESLNTSITNLNSATQSLQAQLTTIGTQSGSWGGGSTNTGSLMVTGSVNVNVLTFTKGDGSTFNLTVAASGSAPAGTVSGSQQIVDYGIFATTGSNTFKGDQTINAKLYISGSSNTYIQFTSANNATGSGAIYFGNLGPYIQTYSAGSNQDRQGLQLVAGLSGSFALVSRYAGPQGEVDLQAQVEQGVSNEQSRLRIKASAGIEGTSSGQISLSGSSTYIQNLKYPSADGTNGQVLTTNGSGILTFTTVGGGGINTGSFATTGSNTFNGSQTINGNVLVVGSNRNIEIVANTAYSGSPYSSVNVYVDQTTDAANVYSQIGLVDALTYQQVALAKNSYSSQYPNQTVDMIIGGGAYSATSSDTTIAFPTDSIDLWKPTSVKVGLNSTGSITIKSGSGDLYVHGHKQFNCGGFQTNITQSGSANVSQSVNFEVTDVSYGVTIASNSRITMANAGVYSLTFSAQLKADAGADTVRMWLKKNGTNVPESTTKLALRNNEEAVMTVNFIVEAANSDYFEIVWQSEQGDAVLFAENASGNYPAIPSVIVTAVQVR